jgi:hypothetical protein
MSKKATNPPPRINTDGVTTRPNTPPPRPAPPPPPPPKR